MTKENSQKAVKALIFSKGKFLLLFKSGKEDVSPSEWDIPGGRVKPGESQEAALTREVREETGIDISSSKVLPIKTWEMKKDEFKLSGTDFLCVLSEPEKIKLGAEHTGSQWLSKEEIMAGEEIPSWLKETVERASGLDF